MNENQIHELVAIHDEITALKKGSHDWSTQFTLRSITERVDKILRRLEIVEFTLFKDIEVELQSFTQLVEKYILSDAHYKRIVSFLDWLITNFSADFKREGRFSFTVHSFLKHKPHFERIHKELEEAVASEQKLEGRGWEPKNTEEFLISIGLVERTFKCVHALKSDLLRQINNFLQNVSAELSELKSAIRHLRMIKGRLDEQLDEEFTYIISTAKMCLNYLEYHHRKGDVDKNLALAMRAENRGHHKLLAEVIRGMFTDSGNSYLNTESLGINYDDPAQTFNDEFGKIEFGRVKKSVKEAVHAHILELLSIIKNDYRIYCDSVYHGFEHMALVFITSVRIFRSYNASEKVKLSVQDFLELCDAALIHDTGYHLGRAVPGNFYTMSYLNHVGHEKKSAAKADWYLGHFKKDLEIIFGSEKKYPAILKSIQKIILTTEISKAMNGNEDILEKMIATADLMQMCHEEYLDSLVPLNREFKVGDRNNQAADLPIKNVDDLIHGTYYFMTKFPRVGTVITPMAEKYLDAQYPAYKTNRTNTGENIKTFSAILKENEMQLDQAYAKVRSATG